jgi:ABC-type Fe3+/spermidine/putrescine transport system ATPase subunit
MSDRVAVMRGGRVLQEGDPKTLYEAPVDRFVADFIGVSNFIAGRVVGRESNGGASPILIVETDDGTRIRAAGRHPDPAPGTGDRVVVVVRPERMRLGPADGAGVPGRLVEATYLGEAIESRVDTTRLGQLVVRHQNGDPAVTRGAAVGDEVTVSWDDTTAVALPE